MKNRPVFFLLLLLCLLGGWLLWQWDKREDRYDELIRRAAARYGVEPGLVKAVIWKESRFKKNVRGRAGEIGLMQIREPAAREWAAAEKLFFFDHEDLFDPEKNIQAGTWYLKQMLVRYRRNDRPEVYALAAYNAGAGNVAKWSRGASATNSAKFLGSMGFPSTRQYVKSILQRRARHQKQFAK